MTLVALVFSKRPLALFFVAFDARAVEGRHAIGNKVGSFLSCMAGLAIGVFWADGRFACAGQHGAHFYLGVAGGAALHLFVKHVLMAGSALGMHGCAQGGHGCIACFLVAVGAILRFRLNVLVFVVALAAVDSVLFGMFVMAPFGGFEFHMVTGHARGQVVDFFDMILFERLIKHYAVTGAAALDVLSFSRVFVVAFLAFYLVVGGMYLVVKNNLASGIF